MFNRKILEMESKGVVLRPDVRVFFRLLCFLTYDKQEQ